MNNISLLKITQAVILAGGRGKRLRSFTNKNPKPMIPIKRKPFLEYLIELLKGNNIKEVVILTGYQGDKIEKYFEDGSKFGVKIKYSYTPFFNENKEENKSGIRLKNAQELLDDYFLLMYCDNYWPLQLKKLLTFYQSRPSSVLVTAYTNLDHSTKNNLFIDQSGYVTKYDRSREKRKLNGVDIGFFIVDKKVLALLPESNSQFEEEVLPKLIKTRKLSGYLTDDKYYSISDLQRAKITERFLSPKKVVFLDRDGVINKRPKRANYVKSWEEFEFLPGSIKAIRLFNHLGYKIFVISNQAGIARGELTKRQLNNIHKNMIKQLKKNNAKIDGIYYCPHGWDEGCLCRKPKPGLLYQASREHLIDLTKALFIGDDERDKEAGEAAGCKTILVNEKKNLLYIVNSLHEN